MNYKKRIERVRQSLAALPRGAALLLSSAPPVIRSRDSFYPYRQHSDFYYLTGSVATDLAILVVGHQKRPVLFAKPVDKHTTVWDGKPPSPRPVAERIDAELVVSNEMEKEIERRLPGVDTFFYQNVPGSVSAAVAGRFMERPAYALQSAPREFLVSDVILERLRLIKEPEEIRVIEHAGRVTAEAMREALEMVRPGVVERDISHRIEYEYRRRGSEVAFPSIIATGPSAAVLHYRDGGRKLKAGEMLLMDCGAEYQLYAGDITRVVPVGGRFEGWQREVYEIVLASQKAALKKIKHGVKIDAVYSAAARVLTEGLVELRVLKGKPQKLFEERAYRDYFPHGIGHGLGLDVHDVGRLRGNLDAVLEKNMVFTVEPGLYFPKRVGSVPGCGVRIEDDVVVTEQGCRILTSVFPKEVSEVEAIVS